MLFVLSYCRSRFKFALLVRFAAAGVPAMLAFALTLAAAAQQTSSPDSQAPAAAAAPQPAPQDSSQAPAQTAPQQPSPQQSPQAPAASTELPSPQESAPAPAQTAPQQPAPPQQDQAAPPVEQTQLSPVQDQSITEDEIKQLLVGKALYLRGGYLDDSLSFNQQGKLVGRSPEGSYTLCGVEIDKVRLTKHKLELEGARYGLHFLGELPYEDPTSAFDRVRITPKKKMLKITIDREVVIKPKKEKVKKESAKAKPAAPGPAPRAPSAAPAPPESATASAPPSAGSAAASAEPSDAEEAKAEIASEPPEDRPADPSSLTTTTSPAHAAMVLKKALDAVFSVGLDDRLLASMPDFWKLYYQAAAAKKDFRPNDPSVQRQNTVDTKARLLTTFEPPSNEYAQASGVAGMSLYHAVIGVDGKTEEIAVARPIGFGLDENAVDAIRNARFAPAVKDGKPVPVLLDLVVQFRIYSKRTAVTGNPEEAGKPPEPALPGPYSVSHN